MALRERHAAAELLVRGTHAAADVVGIAQSAECIRLRFARSGRDRAGERSFMLAHALVRAAQAENQIAAQVMQA